jgi:hypothetical protein
MPQVVEHLPSKHEALTPLQGILSVISFSTLATTRKGVVPIPWPLCSTLHILKANLLTALASLWGSG